MPHTPDGPGRLPPRRYGGPEDPPKPPAPPAPPAPPKPDPPGKTMSMALPTISMSTYEPDFKGLCKTLFGKEPEHDDAGRMVLDLGHKPVDRAKRPGWPDPPHP